MWRLTTSKPHSGRYSIIENGRIREHATAESLARDPEPLIRYVCVRRAG